MDALITAAARALAAGDVLGALNRVALRDDPPALALRGIAMARLGELARGRELIRQAARGFGAHETVARARCAVAEAEIALVSRDLSDPDAALDAARTVLESHNDWVNAAHARHVQARRHVLLGQLDSAEQDLSGIDAARLPPAWRAAHELAVAAIALRRVHGAAAQDALDRAASAAAQANIPALIHEVAAMRRTLDMPAARLLVRGQEQTLRLRDVEAVLASGTLVVDACRAVVRDSLGVVSLASRPVLLRLARTLAEAWPAEVARDVLVAHAFRARQADESHRARLRVEMGRLRALLRGLASVTATPGGFVLSPRHARGVAVLAQPEEGPNAAVLALLADGEAWSSSALSMALGTSQRNVQRALEALAEARKVQPIGQGRARRWMAASLPGFTTSLLLPAPLPGV